MLRTGKSRGYSLEMICADLLAGATWTTETRRKPIRIETAASMIADLNRVGPKIVLASYDQPFQAGPGRQKAAPCQAHLHSTTRDRSRSSPLRLLWLPFQFVLNGVRFTPRRNQKRSLLTDHSIWG